MGFYPLPIRDGPSHIIPMTNPLDKEEPEAIVPEHLPAVLEGLAQAKRREFATHDEVEAAFRRFDR